jgi:integrase
LAAVAARCLWDELDLQSRIWTLPNLRTKNARPHIVHLSDQAIAALERAKQRGAQARFMGAAVAGRGEATSANRSRVAGGFFAGLADLVMRFRCG